MMQKISIFLLLFCPFAYSDDDINDFLFELSLEELLNIKVEVASLFNESELEISNTVELITEADWKKTSSKNLLQAVNNLPAILPLTNIWGGAIPIRGYANNLSVRGTSFLIDGIPLNNLADMTTSYDFHFFDLGALSRIEVVRGPGSSIYGSDAFHGVFSLKTHFEDTNETIVNLGVGGDGYNQFSLKSNVGLGENHRLNAIVGYTNQGDQNLVYEYNDPTDAIDKTATRENSYQTLTAILKINGQYENNFRSQLAVYYSDFNSKEFPGAVRGLLNGISLARDEDNSDNDTSAKIIRAEVGHELANGIDISLMGYLMDTRVKRFVNFKKVNATYSNNLKVEDSTGLDLTIKQDNRDINTKWLLRAQYKNAHLKDDYSEWFDLDDELLSKNISNANDYKRTTKSIAAQGKTSFSDNSYHVIYGARLDDYSDLGTQLTPSAGFIYQPTDDSSIKLNYGQAYRAASPNELLGTNLISKNTSLEPETIDTYELSYIKHSKNTRSVITAFTSKWTGAIQIKDGIYKNAGKNSSEGIEASFNGKFSAYSFDLNMSYVVSSSDTEDFDYSAFPKYIINLGIGYELEAYDLNFYLSNRIHLQTDAGPITNIVTDPEELSTYFKTDFHLEWSKLDNISIWLDINNLANRKNTIPSLWNVENGIPDEALSVSLGFTYRG